MVRQFLLFLRIHGQVLVDNTAHSLTSVTGREARIDGFAQG